MTTRQTGDDGRGDDSGEAAARHASEQRLGALIAQSLAGVVEVDAEGRVMWFNDRYAEITGQPRATLHGRHLSEYTAPADWERQQAALERLRRGGAPEILEMVYLRQDGGVTFAQVSFTAIPDAAGLVGGFFGLATDITALRGREQDLLKARNSLAEAQQIAHLGSFEYDAVTHETRWSDEEFRIFGLDPAGPSPDYGTLLAHSIHPDDALRLHQTFTADIKTRSAHALEHRIIRPDGSIRWVYEQARPYFDADGTLVRYIGTTLDITARKEAELALRRYRQIVEASTEKLFFIDRDLRYQVVNPAYAAMLQSTPDALQGRALAAVLPPALWTQIRPSLEEVLVTGRPGRFQIELTHPDGHTRWLEAEQQPFWEGGQIQGVVVSLHDLTAMRAVQAELEAERAHLEQRVRERTAELQTLAERVQLANEAAGIGVWEWDLAADRIIWDARVYALFGLTERDGPPAYATWAARVHPDDLPRVQAGFDAIFQGQTDTLRDEYRFRWPDGTERVLGLIGRCARGARSGTAPVLRGINWDLTTEQQAAATLAASEARARAVIDSSPVPLVIAHETGPVRYLNAAFTQTFGYTLEDIPTWTDFRRLAIPDPAERERISQLRQAQLAQFARDDGRCDPVEFSIHCKDGTARTVLARVTPLAGGERLNTLFDVTELQQARDAAEQAARVKADFLAHMSHELRTPMNTVLGLLQVLERGALAPDQRAMVRTIRSAGRSLLGILNDILDLSKIEAGQFPLETRPFGLAALLARIESLQDAAAHDKGLALTIAPAPALEGSLLGDPLRLEQVLINLIGNAIKFTDRGEVRLGIALLECTADQARLRFSVSDTGIGIDPAVLTGLFNPFTQADSGITRRFGGTGLGLAICKRLVEAMGGAIGADSQPGVGSTFWCELPFARTAEAPPGDPEPHPSTEPSGPRLGGLRLLVVDDSPMNREVLTQLLALEGASATSAGHGQEAIDQLRTHAADVDAVLMDVQMPVMDGLTATSLIRTELGLSELPVIACTAGVLQTEQAAARAAGATDLLLKPVELEALVAVLHRWTTPRPVTAAGPSPVPTAPAAFPALPGLDPAHAAQCLGQNLRLFRTLLELFGEEFAAVAAETRAALAAGDPATAARRMHTLRGNAGSLGALALMETAAGLEAAIERGEAALDPQLEALDTQVTALIAAGTAWCGATRPAPAAAADAPPLEPGQLDALRAALRTRNLQALHDFETLQPALQGALGEAHTQALARAIRDLRYAEALTVLDQVTTADADPP